MHQPLLRCFLPVWAASLALAQAPAPAANPAPPAPAPAPAAAPAPAPDHVVISIGEERITVAQFEALINSLPEQYRAMARGPAKRQFAEQLVAIKTLAQEARKRKLDQSESYRRQLAFQEENLLAGALFQNLTDSIQVDEAAARNYYEQHKGEYESVKARHVLVRFKGSPVPLKQGREELTEEQALARVQELRKRLLAGEDFAAVAKAESDDATSAGNGGDLGNFRRGQMVPAFDAAVFSLPLRQISEPVKTQFGFHLIRVEDRSAQSFEEVRGDVDKKVRPEAVKAELENLRRAAKITLDENFFGAAPPMPMNPAAAPARR